MYRSLRIFCVIVCLVLMPQTSLASIASGQSPHSLSLTEKGELAHAYAPQLRFDEGERVFPVDVGYFLNCSDLRLFSDPTIIQASPGQELIGSAPYSTPDIGYYLDNRFGGIYDDGVILKYEADLPTLNTTVYSHVTEDGGRILVQYWMFYVFDFGPYNRHQGDWEMVEYVLDEAKVPLEAVYSQHDGSQGQVWNDVQLAEGHPVIYVARGSHANFPAPSESPVGPGADSVGGNGLIVSTYSTGFNLVLLGERGNHTNAQTWLDFAGNWGKYGSTTDAMFGRIGPLGPCYRDGGVMYSSASWGASQLTGGSTSRYVVMVVAIVLTSLALAAIAIRWRGRERSQ